MGSSGLPDDVLRFIADHIDSVEQLEVLLLLRKRASEDWTGESTARELRIDPRSAGGRLERLAAKSLLVPSGDGAYRFAPAQASADFIVRRLADCYAERRVAVITAIFSKPSENVRSFADAFKLRGKD